MCPHECKKSAINATKLILGNVGYSLICISQQWRTRKDRPAHCYRLCCIALCFSFLCSELLAIKLTSVLML